MFTFQLKSTPTHLCQKTIFAFAFILFLVSCERSQKAANELGTDDSTNLEQASVVYSEYSEITGGTVAVYVRNKDRITCGTNHIFFKVQYVDPKRIHLTATGGALYLEDAKSRTYTFKTNCRSDKNGIFLSWVQAEGEIVTIARIPLALEKRR